MHNVQLITLSYLCITVLYDRFSDSQGKRKGTREGRGRKRRGRERGKGMERTVWEGREMGKRRGGEGTAEGREHQLIFAIGPSLRYSHPPNAGFSGRLAGRGNNMERRGGKGKEKRGRGDRKWRSGLSPSKKIHAGTHASIY